MSDLNSVLTQEDIEELERQKGEDLFASVRIPVASTVPVDVKTFVTASELAQVATIDPHDIENSLITVSAFFSRFNLLASQARLQRDSFASRKDLLEARLDKAYRDEAAKNEEKITEPKLAASIQRNVQLIEATCAVNEAKAVLAVIEGTLESIKMKRDMLVQLNKNNREEWEMTTTAVPSGLDTNGMKARLAQAKKASRDASAR